MNAPADHAAGPLATRVPIFPLQTVLFPHGVLPLRVFEARYIDMTARCLREDSLFGVCLIAQGGEIGEAAVPYSVGVGARIVECDMTEPGLLHVVARGERRFRILDTEVGQNNLLVAEVEWLAEPPPQPLPAHCAALENLLRAIIADVGEAHFPSPHRLDEAGWVGMQLASVLPLSLPSRQALLEVDDPLVRLEVLRTYLAQQGLEDA